MSEQRWTINKRQGYLKRGHYIAGPSTGDEYVEVIPADPNLVRLTEEETRAILQHGTRAVVPAEIATAAWAKLRCHLAHLQEEGS